MKTLFSRFWGQRIPVLTPKIVETVLKEPYENVVLYDCNRNKINRNQYNEHFVFGDKYITKSMPEFKDFCKKSVVIAERIPVAIVAKTCTYIDKTNNEYCVRGRSIAGNIIFYSTQSGTYSSLPGGWFRAGGRFCWHSASEEALLQTVKFILENKSEIERFAKQKIR